MALSLGFDFGTSESSGTQRSSTGWDSARFRQFLKDISSTIGGPFTVGDLFTLAPRTGGLFQETPMTMGQGRPGGGFNLGFGTPPGYKQPGAPPPEDGTPPTDDGEPSTPQKFSMNDLLPAYNDDPEKRMDLPRLFRQAGIDPNGFTYEEFEKATAKAKKYGFSGRSSGNFGKALSLLQSITQTSGKFGGGKGTGIF